MSFKLFYERVERTTEFFEHSEKNDMFDKWVPRTTLNSEMRELYTSAELYDIINKWFRYIESGNEGENRAEGHGWYFILYVEVDKVLIDVTEHFLNHFDKLKDKLISGEIK